MARDIASIPAGLGEASGTETPVATTLASLIEGARRTGAGFINLGRMGLDKAITGFLTNPINPTSGLIQSGINQIRSRTPSEQEIQNAFQEQVLQQSLNRPENRLVQGEISEPLAQGTSAALPAAIPLIGSAERAAAAGLARIPVTGLANTIERVVARGVTKPLEDIVTNTTGIAAIDGGVETAQIAKTRIVEKTGKFPTRESGAAETVIKQAEDTGKLLINESKDFLKAAGDEGLVVNELSGVENAKAIIRDRFKLGTADEGSLEAIFNKPEFRNLKNSVNPLETQSHLQELNTKYHQLEPRFKTSAEAMAYKIVRDNLSEQVDSLVKIKSGRDISPYRDWGYVQDFKNGITDRIRSAQQIQAGMEPTQVGGIPLSKPGLVVKGAKAVGGRPLVPRAIESINQGAVKMGTGLKNLPAGRRLTANEIASLKARLNPPPIIGASPVSQASVSPLQTSIETQAENLVRRSGGQISLEEAIDIATSQAEEGFIPRRR